MMHNLSSVRSEIVVAVGFNPRGVVRMAFLAPVGAAYFTDSILPRWGDMPPLVCYSRSRAYIVVT